MFLFPRLSASASTASIAPVLNKRLFSSFQPKDKILVTSLTPKFHDFRGQVQLLAISGSIMAYPATVISKSIISNYAKYADTLGLISSCCTVTVTSLMLYTTLVAISTLPSLKKLQLMQEKQEPTTFEDLTTIIKNAKLPEEWSTYATIRLV